MTALRVNELATGYGGMRILSGISFEVAAGSIAALIGGNGSGKTTLLRAVAGLIPAWEGEVSIDDQPVGGWPTSRRIRAGLSMVGADSVFDGLEVREHFELMRGLVEDQSMAYRDRVEEMLGHFPMLRDRFDHRAGSMSGGERQTLALAAALLPRPKIMLVDELSLGLAPRIVEQIMGMLPRLAAAEGTAFLVVEQHPDIVLELAGDLVILVRGQVAYRGDPARFQSNPRELAAFYLGSAPENVT